jgi:hypothetical protein
MFGEPCPFAGSSNTILDLTVQDLPVLSRLVLSPELPGGLLMTRAMMPICKTFRSYVVEKITATQLHHLENFFVIIVTVSFTFSF